jgi:hypothetical protein
MNGLLVLGSDYLIVPASPTFFSLMAVDNLEYIFQEWHSRLSSTTQYGFKMDVKFLGIFFQMAKKFEAGTKKVGDDERFSRYANHWITEINKSSVEFYKYASRKEWSIDKDKFGDIFKKRYDPFIIEKCCDFTGKLRGYSETFGVPILALNQIVNHKDLEKDIKMPQYQAALEQVKEVYKNTVDGLLKL